ncbi:arginine metabolism regulation protein ii [Ophiostoma piceae UAMH 11346]|uniref:Arginine metabolism regulation protein ii n=1 Tax=Ophiostoma piceae (strain UAMH 11346) TaxID=1262450 RepID=S3BVP6_OPHP1|nr:arginine metabolism regulation protein ii [Ophiostoma piceae UAMH 11346]
MQQAKQKQKGPTQRSMTFRGCFTCRFRGVKCDEQKPSCQRCVKAGRECAGYGVRLVWADQENQETQKTKTKNSKTQKTKKIPSAGPRSQRRSLPWAYGAADGAPAETPALGDDVLDAIIAALPSEPDAADAKTHEHPHADLFGVFAAAPPPPSPSSQQLTVSLSRRASANCIPSPVLQACLDDLDNLDNVLDPALVNSMHGLDPTDILDAIFNIALEPLHVPTPYTAAHGAHHSASMARLYPSPPPSKESQLLDYWVTHTSNIMISIPRSDNPYRTIYIPMALAAQSQLVPSAEHAALLHSIFAIVAFNHAQKQPLASRGTYNRLGMDHHQLSISHLHRSLTTSRNQEPEVVLATIILLISINCVTCSSSSWRTYLRLGRQWLMSTGLTKWHTEQSASTLYQIFLMLEALGESTDICGLPGGSGSTDSIDGLNVLNAMDSIEGVDGMDGLAGIDGINDMDDIDGLDADTDVSTVLTSSHHASDYTYSNIFGLSCPAVSYYYRLDCLFGIAQPIFEAIVHINRLSARAGPPSQHELDNLRAKIMLNDPRALRSDTLALAGATERRFIHHHAYVYYFACRIHYERTLFHVAPQAIQNLVRNALDHLDAIAHLGSNVDVVGLTWPVIVVACEADDPSLQKRVAWFFEQGQKHGVWGISSAYQVLSEVWRRRKAQPRDGYADVSWQNVMRELGLDLLLA